MAVWQRISFLPRLPLLLLIALYQKTFSPDHGFVRIFFPHGYCKFYPSCSMYGYNVIEKYGLMRGVPKMLYRIARCNPLSKGGIDLPS
jgi:putative membrane protein insertion efficiency factor